MTKHIEITFGENKTKIVCKRNKNCFTLLHQTTTIMEKIIEQLKIQTVELKAVFIERTKEFAASEFDKLVLLTENDIINDRGYRDYSMQQRYPEGVMRHTKASFAYWGKVRNMVANGKTGFIAIKASMAAEAYENSMFKIGKKIVEKGMDVLNITMSTESKLSAGGHITTTITDGQKTIRAFTVLAWGEINAPHYRYLIK